MFYKCVCNVEFFFSGVDFFLKDGINIFMSIIRLFSLKFDKDLWSKSIFYSRILIEYNFF